MTQQTKRVKLSDMLDDNSPYMNELIDKFLVKHGEELERIMGREVPSKDS